MSTQTIKKSKITASPVKQDVIAVIDSLSDTSMEKLASYAAFLRYEEEVEAREDAEDIADAEARRGEPNIPFEEVIAKFEAEHGPLDQD